jgi:hypothetical protein
MPPLLKGISPSLLIGFAEIQNWCPSLTMFIGGGGNTKRAI